MPFDLGPFNFADALRQRSERMRCYARRLEPGGGQQEVSLDKRKDKSKLGGGRSGPRVPAQALPYDGLRLGQCGPPIDKPVGRAARLRAAARHVLATQLVMILAIFALTLVVLAVGAVAGVWAGAVATYLLGIPMIFGLMFLMVFVNARYGLYRDDSWGIELALQQYRGQQQYRGHSIEYRGHIEYRGQEYRQVSGSGLAMSHLRPNAILQDLTPFFASCQ